MIKRTQSETCFWEDEVEVLFPIPFTKYNPKSWILHINKHKMILWVSCFVLLFFLFCLAMYIPDWTLEKPATWKCQWAQTKKVPRKASSSSQRTRKGAAKKDRRLLDNINSTKTLEPHFYPGQQNWVKSLGLHLCHCKEAFPSQLLCTWEMS